jgi:hypothetical protein
MAIGKSKGIATHHGVATHTLPSSTTSSWVESGEEERKLMTASFLIGERESSRTRVRPAANRWVKKQKDVAKEKWV